MRVSPIFATNCRLLKSNKNLNFGKFENNQTRDFIKREYVDPEIKKENERNAGFKVKSFAQEVFDYLDATPFATIKKGEKVPYAILEKDIAMQHENKNLFQKLYQRLTRRKERDTRIVGQNIVEKESNYLRCLRDFNDLSTLYLNIENCESGYDSSSGSATPSSDSSSKPDAYDRAYFDEWR